MNIAIIGAGNMGSAIATGIIRNYPSQVSLTVSNRSYDKLEALKSKFPSLEVTCDNKAAVKGADIMILAVKPKVLKQVALNLWGTPLPRIIISVVAGIGTEELISMFGKEHAYFYVMPNTAVMVSEGLSFVSYAQASEGERKTVKEILECLGQVAFIDEHLMTAATAVSGCGIAYAFKYIQACIQAGVQLGFSVDDAQRYAVQTVKGAMAVLEKTRSCPQKEIDRVTSPGGMTIRGINRLEKEGFTNAVIQAIIEPIKDDK